MKWLKRGTVGRERELSQQNSVPAAISGGDAVLSTPDGQSSEKDSYANDPRNAGLTTRDSDRGIGRGVSVPAPA